MRTTASNWVRSIAPAVLGAIVCIIIGIIVGRAIYKAPPQRPSHREEAFNEFCTLTRMTLDSDIRALESGSPSERRYAVEFITGEVVRHGYLSVAMCLPLEVKKKRQHTGCRHLSGGDPDYACFAKRARADRDELVRLGF